MGSLGPQIELTISREDRDWLFQVQDNGIGIDPAYHVKMFVNFLRLNMREKFEGTGLGLAICRKIVSPPRRAHLDRPRIHAGGRASCSLFPLEG
ncbi:hypothetical protein JCM17960_18670 [Magnetospira thiophila]